MQETAESPHPSTWKREERGEEKTQQGETHQPRRKKMPLGREKEKIDKFLGDATP